MGGLPVRRRLREKLSSVLLAFLLCFSWTFSYADPSTQIADYLAGLKLAVDQGHVSSYLKLENSSTAQVKKIVFNPDKIDGQSHTLFLIFDANQNLSHFVVDQQNPVALDGEQRALFSIYKDHQDLIKAFFYRPTPQLRNAMEKMVEPVATEVAGKIAEQLKTKQGQWISNAATDSVALGKKAFTAIKLKAYMGGNLTFRALDSVNCILLGGWMVISILALPLLPALGIIPIAWLPEALPALAIGTVSTFATRKVISFILGKLIKITGEQIKVIKNENKSPGAGIDLNDISSAIDERVPLAKCRSGMGRIFNFVFR
jgi:hypothetical protein